MPLENFLSSKLLLLISLGKQFPYRTWEKHIEIANECNCFRFNQTKLKNSDVVTVYKTDPIKIEPVSWYILPLTKGEHTAI